MKKQSSLSRKSHLLGTKIRNLRKKNNLTIDDLSTRCIRIDAESAPSISYLSMIERGKRVPSVDILEIIAEVFQKDVDWFLDDAPEEVPIDLLSPQKGNRGGGVGMVLEPSFLFSNDILQIAIPEVMSQAGISGRQFAHLLIRAHQEHHQNHFPDLERAAEEIGKKKMPLLFDDLMDITRKLEVSVHWFDSPDQSIFSEFGISLNKMITSYLDPAKGIYLNKQLKKHPTRLKYDIAVHIGHLVLHNKNRQKSVLTAGIMAGESLAEDDLSMNQSATVEAKDILQAWQDFEASFFAGALLCPKIPFRQLLDKHGYEISVHEVADVSPSMAMRRMTAVSPYKHWHYFDAYDEGQLKAVYRGNGIPLPWGSMRSVKDPCQHWAVFRMINNSTGKSSAQISLLKVGDQQRIYCCESVNVDDLSGSKHVLCAGIDLTVAIESQGWNANELALQLQHDCLKQGGATLISPDLQSKLKSVAKILNIGWIERGLENEVRIICARGAACPKEPSCYK